MTEQEKFKGFVEEASKDSVFKILTYLMANLGKYWEIRVVRSANIIQCKNGREDFQLRILGTGDGWICFNAINKDLKKIFKSFDEFYSSFADVLNELLMR